MTLPSQIDLDRRPIPEQIAAGLTRVILSGEPPFGQPLAEATIAADLGVSRNTVREAVRLLERSGLVRYESNRGAVVREPSRSSLTDVYRARAAIEVGGVAMIPADAGDLNRLTVALSGLDAALVDDDAHTVITSDLAFHQAIVALAGSARLVDAFGALCNELTLYLATIAVATGQLPVQPLLAEHQAIATALTDGDRHQVADILSEQLSAESERVIAALEHGALRDTGPSRGQ